VALSRDLRTFYSFHFGFDITFVVEIRHPYKYIQESRFSARDTLCTLLHTEVGSKRLPSYSGVKGPRDVGDGDAGGGEGHCCNEAGGARSACAVQHRGCWPA
jgi:hypothetical protein